jgi:DNA mismatch repair protein MutL
MPKIVVLPDHLASQIAAGEVVERPASVVKELVENALDSAATQIEIAIGSQCRDIRVADNGCGMEADDAVLAFQRHATSKLRSAEDLAALRTLGFRGEALPSIASVSRISCLTRIQQATAGTRVEAQDGKLQARETGCAPGTIIEVTDLFYNVPARLNFMKKTATEIGHIQEIVQSLAVAHPSVQFQLLNEGEVLLRTSGSGKLASVLQEIGIVTAHDRLVSLAHTDARYGLTVQGYVASPPTCRGDRRGLFTIVNNRPVKCSVAYKALDAAFTDLIPRTRYPVGVVSITIDPSEVDVNIHPTKKEIKYRNGSDVYLAILHAAKDALRGSPAAERHGYSSGTGAYVPEQAVTAHSGTPVVHEGINVQAAPLPHRGVRETQHGIQQISLRDRLRYTPSQGGVPKGSPISDPAGEKPTKPADLPAGWRIIGYLHNSYVLLGTPDGLMIVEQHIAHERVIYERLLAQQKNPGAGQTFSQTLVISAPLNLTPEQKAALKDSIEDFRRIGFDFDIDGDEIACSRVPLELATKNYASSVQINVENVICEAILDASVDPTKSVACQAAVKNGMPLSEGEILELLKEWHACPRNDTCPHGRPIALRFSQEKLFEMFHAQ